MNDNASDVVEIDIEELIGLILHWLWLIVGCGIIVGVLGFVVSFFVITPKYESTTRVYILNSNENSSLTYSDTQLATQLTKDYEELITSRYVLEQVISQFGLDMDYEAFKEDITIDNTTDTRIIDITVKNENPAMAQRLADAIRDIASEKIKTVMDIEAVNIVDEANLANSPCEPSIVLWTAVGFLIGIVLSAAVVIIRFLLDDTIKSSDDIERYMELSTLALIPESELGEHHSKGTRTQTGQNKRETTRSSERRNTPEKPKPKPATDSDVVDLEAM